MRVVFVAALIFALAACRGEPTPRDYQNAPPAMTHPVKSDTQTPTARGVQVESPQPSSGAEGTVVKHDTSTTLPDQAPVTTTVTTGTTATTTT